MKQADPKSTATGKRRPKSKGFKPHVPHDWQYNGTRTNSILTTVRRSAEALVAIEARHPEWHSPLAVAQVLLCRLEEMRTEARHRASMAAVALELADNERAAKELTALNELLVTADIFENPARHGVCISKDRFRYGIGIELERIERPGSK